MKEESSQISPLLKVILKPARFIGAVIGATISSSILWANRASWMSTLSNQNIQDKTLKILHKLDALPKQYSYLVYTLGMATWETLGISTIPVETADAMAFGWKGFFLSSFGKLFGAVLAFQLVRYETLNAFIVQLFETIGSNCRTQTFPSLANAEIFMLSRNHQELWIRVASSYLIVDICSWYNHPWLVLYGIMGISGSRYSIEITGSVLASQYYPVSISSPRLSAWFCHCTTVHGLLDQADGMLHK